MTEDEYTEKSIQFAKGTMELAFRMGYATRDSEIVRCKDCKYYEETDETIGTCLLTESGAHVKGYCSWAEVK